MQKVVSAVYDNDPYETLEYDHKFYVEIEHMANPCDGKVIYNGGLYVKIEELSSLEEKLTAAEKELQRLRRIERRAKRRWEQQQQQG